MLPRFCRSLLYLWFGGLVATVASVSAATYYIDASLGSDAANGHAPEAAWRTFAPVNAQVFTAGDRILLRAGGKWEGTTLAPRGSGAAGSPIQLGRYGEGSAPALHGNGEVEAVLRLENQQYWEIADLEITNRAPVEGRRLRGVEIVGRDAGVLRHLYFRRLLIRDVNAASDYRNDGDLVAKSYGGFIALIEGEIRPTAWEDLLVEDCIIRDVGAVGLATFSSWVKGHRANDPAHWFPSRNVVVRGCTFERIARNGLVVRACAAPLIEFNTFLHCGLLGSGNACFVFHCDDALLQFNEAAFTKYNPGDHDAAGFDSDYNCRRTVFQFNYSHHNDYGFILLCNYGGIGFNEGTVVRYNLSHDDNGSVFRLSGPVLGSRIHDNAVFVSPQMWNPVAGEPPRIIYHKSWRGWADQTFFHNNLIVNHSPDAEYELGESTGNRFEANLVVGRPGIGQPDDANAFTVVVGLDDPRQAWWTRRNELPAALGETVRAYRRLVQSATAASGRVPEDFGAQWRAFAAGRTR